MCKCIELKNIALKEKWLRLVTGIRFSKNLEDASVYLPVQIEKIDKSDRKLKVPTLVGNFCPFCGATQHSVEPTVESVGSEPAIVNQSESELPA